MSERVGGPDDSFVAFPFLAEMEAQHVRKILARHTDLAVYLPAGNFDPPEDHPADPEFTWSPILVNDFSDVNDDIGTYDGVSHGDFCRLLQWQPHVDNTKTHLIAIVAPGPLHKTTVAESSSLSILGTMLVENGYDAVAIRCKSGSEEEFVDAASYASRLAETSGLVPLHMAREGRDITGTPFRLSIREL
jgi:hypothetical protein